VVDEESQKPENRRLAVGQFPGWTYGLGQAALARSSVPPERQAVATPREESQIRPRDSYTPAAWTSDALFTSLELQFGQII
jgi:hypothetical protein